jgi:prepilin-type N-terminal cleavage/methylation domain-containing protein
MADSRKLSDQLKAKIEQSLAKRRLDSAVILPMLAVMALQPRVLSHAGVRRKSACAAITLVELLCTMAIIAILLALYLPAVARAFRNASKFLFGE